MFRTALFLTAAAAAFGASIMPPVADQRLALAIYKEMVEINSGFTTGATTPIAEAVAKRLRAAGFAECRYLRRRRDSQKGQSGRALSRYGQAEARAAAGAYRRGRSQARRLEHATRSRSPRRTAISTAAAPADDKAQAAIWIANLIRYKREGFKPDRDIIVALTADEEGGGPYNGVEWLLKNQRELIDAEFCLNEGGWGQMVEGTRISNDMQASRKVVSDLRLEVRNKGGHSSHARGRQRHLSPGRRARAHRPVRLPAQDERGHARLLSGMAKHRYHGQIAPTWPRWPRATRKP